MVATDWLYLILFTFALFLLIGLAELVRRFMNWSPEATRKSVHMLVGILVATTPFVLDSMWPMVFLGISFAILDFIAVRKHMLVGMHGTKRQTYGTVFYPTSFVILVLLLWDHSRLILVASMLIMALSDAFAAIVGEHVKKPVLLYVGPERKSLQGSLTMFGSTFVIVVGCLLLFPDSAAASLSLLHVVWIAVVVALMATASEMISAKGSDNLTVPLASAFSMYYLLFMPVHSGMIFTLGMGLALFIAVVSLKLKFLNIGGSVALFILGSLVFGVGGWTFAVPILTFFVLSSVLSKLGKKRKEILKGVFEKSSQRDAGQVLANGGVAGLMLLVWYFLQSDMYFVLYVAALAAVTSDTWGTEIGVMSRSQPISILSFRKVPMGTSGGVSLLGTWGGVMGSGVLGVTGWWSAMFTNSVTLSGLDVLVIVVAGVFGGLLDSVLGATVQAQYACPACSKITEKRFHCDDHTTMFHRGYAWINNDVVNGLCAVGGVLFAGGMYLLLLR